MSRHLLARHGPRIGRRSAGFHGTCRAWVKVGDRLPDLEVLAEGSPGKKVNLAKELGTKKGLIIGVPAAFSPSCSAQHIPSFIEHAKLKDAGDVFVVSVNDPFVTRAWGKSLDPNGASKIRFLADPAAKFTNALDLSFDGSAVFGGTRSKRYALLMEAGKVKEAFVEPDNTGVDVTTGKNVLG